jgi:hypothetical protein
VLVMLMLESNSPSGAIARNFEIPAGLAGRSFQIIGAALAQDGTLTFEIAIVRIVAN